MCRACLRMATAFRAVVTMGRDAERRFGGDGGRLPCGGPRWSKGVSELCHTMIYGRPSRWGNSRRWERRSLACCRTRNCAGRVRAAAKVRVATHFAWPDIVARYEGLYRRLLAQDRPRRSRLSRAMQC